MREWYIQNEKKLSKEGIDQMITHCIPENWLRTQKTKSSKNESRNSLQVLLMFSLFFTSTHACTQREQK